MVAEEKFDTSYGTVTAGIEYGSSSLSDPTETKSGATEVSVKNVGAVQYMLDIPHDKVVCIDIETTGLRYSSDEILQVAICNGDGELLLNSYVKPSKRKRWPEAQKVNGITYEMVEHAPSIENLSYSIERILGSASLIIGYNVKQFDFEFLKRGRVNIPTDTMVYDLINDCSVTYGKWSDYYGNYSFVNLESMANQYGIKYSPHNAASDVVATIGVFYHLLKDRKFIAMVSKIEENEAKKQEACRLAKEQEIKRLEEEERIAQQKQIDHKKKVKQANRTAVGCLIAIIVVFVLLVASCTASCNSSRRYRSRNSGYSTTSRYK